jgi:hypothetical protein
MTSVPSARKARSEPISTWGDSATDQTLLMKPGFAAAVAGATSGFDTGGGDAGSEHAAITRTAEMTKADHRVFMIPPRATTPRKVARH